MVAHNAADITLDFKDAIKDVIYQSAEFEHLKAFLGEYLYANYGAQICYDLEGYLVLMTIKGDIPHRHHSFSNCVEWVFKNCELVKE